MHCVWTTFILSTDTLQIKSRYSDRILAVITKISASVGLKSAVKESLVFQPNKILSLLQLTSAVLSLAVRLIMKKKMSTQLTVLVNEIKNVTALNPGC